MGALIHILEVILIIFIISPLAVMKPLDWLWRKING
jgi:hypothetical protein